MKNHIEQLKQIYKPYEAKILLRQLICHITGLSLTQLLSQAEINLSKDQSLRLDDYVSRLMRHEPIQHVLGFTEFYGLRFKCDKRALIPRPETEELVEWIISDHKTDSEVSILDIGTGSGCIAISLALNLHGSNVSAMDISLDALSLAKENAKLQDADISFINDNILKSHTPTGCYSIIVSNPPYVRECEKADMEANVLDYDPSLALFVSDEDPLIFYRAIADYGLKCLSKGGNLYFEINQYLDEEICEMLSTKGYSDVQMRKDINGNPRMVKAVKNSN